MSFFYFSTLHNFSCIYGVINPDREIYFRGHNYHENNSHYNFLSVKFRHLWANTLFSKKFRPLRCRSYIGRCTFGFTKSSTKYCSQKHDDFGRLRKRFQYPRFELHELFIYSSDKKLAGSSNPLCPQWHKVLL